MKDDYISGKFQVWHRQADGFRLAATVESNLLGAIIKPIAGPGHPLSKGVEYTEAWQRPTTFGDKLVDGEGKAFEIYEDKQLEMVAARDSTHPSHDNYDRQMAEQARRMPPRQPDSERER